MEGQAMPRPEFIRPLPDGDYRTARAYLSDEAFALAEGANEPPDDQLPEPEWEHLMDLPTDVRAPHDGLPRLDGR